MKRLAALAAFLALAACGEKAQNTGGAESETASPPSQTTASAAEVTTASTVKTAAAPSTPEERGRRQFNECAICHTVKEGEANRIGPNLFGVAGSPAAQADGFAYSKAMTESGLVWTDENLDAFLENPPAFLRGTRMAYAGQRDAEKRADLIAYLKTLK